MTTSSPSFRVAAKLDEDLRVGTLRLHESPDDLASGAIDPAEQAQASSLAQTCLDWFGLPVGAACWAFESDEPLSALRVQGLSRSMASLLIAKALELGPPSNRLEPTEETTAEPTSGMLAISEQLARFTDFWERLAEFPDDDAPRLQPRPLFLSAIESQHAFPWADFESLCVLCLRNRVQAAGEVTADEHWMLALARDVARRHQGEAALLAWPQTWPDFVDTPLRLRIAAHLLQSAADSELGLVQLYLERAGELLVRPDASEDASAPAALELRGAMGRAAAAVGELEAARKLLAEALEGWEALGLRRQSSYALCESLRLCGLQHQLAQLGVAADDAEQLGQTRFAALTGRYQLSDFEGLSQEYVRVSWARALLELGQPSEALSMLEWESADPNVEGMRLRWRCAARSRAGRAENPAELERLAKLGFADYALLARLTLSLDALAKDPSPQVERQASHYALQLFEHPLVGHEARRLALRLDPERSYRALSLDSAFLRRLLIEYRY